MTRKKQQARMIVYIILGLVSLTFLIPYLYILVASTQNNQEILSTPPRFLPSTHLLENLKFLFEEYNFWRVVLNTFIMAAASSILGTLVCSMAGYALVKFDFRGKKLFFNWLMFTTFVPSFTTLIPMFIMFSAAHLNNTYLALILPGLAYAGNIFMMKQFMTGFPDALIEAGRVEGLSEIGIFFRLVMPIMFPSVLTSALMIFVGSWNAYLWPLVIVSKEDMFVISMVIKNISAQADELMYGVRMALAGISIIPIIILYVWMQRKMQSTGVSEAIK